MRVMPTRHIETAVIPGYRLGLRPNDPCRPVLKLADILAATPPHPTSVDHLSKVTAWGMLANDRYGDCGPAAVDHDRMLVSKYLSGRDVTPDTTAVLDLYKRSGNPAFPADDNGVVMADMLAEVARNGIGGVKCVAYAQVNTANLDEVRAAISIFGSLHLGCNLQVAQQSQTSKGGPWDYSPSPVWGGHAVLAGQYSSDTIAAHSDISVVTWGEVIGTTDSFWARQVQECWVVIWPEHLGSVAFQQGIDHNALAAVYKSLTGRDLPTVTPPPITPPTVDAADKKLVTAVGPWAQQRHPWAQNVADAINTWRTSKGL